MRTNERSAAFAAAVITVFIVSAALSAWSASRNFEGALSHEFCQYAETARNILAGEGMRTRMIYPSVLAALDARGIPFGEYNPVLDRFPLHIWLTAAAQSLWGANDAASLLLSIFSLALLASGTAYAAGLLWGGGAALSAGLIVAAAPSFQRGFVLWGLPDLGFAVLTLAAAGLLVSMRGRKASWLWAAAGMIAGLAWLYRSNFLVWLPLFAAWIFWRGGAGGNGRPAARLLAWLGGFLLAAAPGLAYNLLWYGSATPPVAAWNLAHHVVVEAEPWLQYRVFTLRESLGHPLLLAQKWFSLFWLHLKGWPPLWQFHLVWPAAAWGAADLWRRRKQESAAFEYAAFYAAMLVIQVSVFCFLRYEELGGRVAGRYYLWFAPAAAMLAVRGAAGMRAPLRLAYFAAVFAFALRWLAMPQGAPAYPGGLPVRDWPELKAAAGAAGPRGLVATNLPGQVVWYAGRRALQLPSDPAQLAAIMRRHRVDAILLSRLPLGEPGNLPGWRAIATGGEDLKAFCLGNGFRRVNDMGTSVVIAR